MTSGEEASVDTKLVVESGLAFLLQYCTRSMLTTRPEDPIMHMIQIFRQGHIKLESHEELLSFLKHVTSVDNTFLLGTLRASLPTYFTYCAHSYEKIVSLIESTSEVFARRFNDSLIQLKNDFEVDRTTVPVSLQAACHLGISRQRCMAATTPQLVLVVLLLKNSDGSRVMNPTECFLRKKVQQLEWALQMCPVGSTYKFFVVDGTGSTANESTTTVLLQPGRTVERVVDSWHPRGREGIQVLYAKAKENPLSVGLNAATQYWQSVQSTFPATSSMLWVEQDTTTSVHMGEIGHAIFALTDALSTPDTTAATTTGATSATAKDASPAGKKPAAPEKKITSAAPTVVVTCAAVFSRRHPNSYVTLPTDESFPSNVHRMPDPSSIEKFSLHIARSCVPAGMIPKDLLDVNPPVVVLRPGILEGLDSVVGSLLAPGLSLAVEVGAVASRKMKQNVAVLPVVSTEDTQNATSTELSVRTMHAITQTSTKYCTKKEKEDVDDTCKAVLALNQQKWSAKVQGKIPDAVSNFTLVDIGLGKCVYKLPLE